MAMGGVEFRNESHRARTHRWRVRGRGASSLRRGPRRPADAVVLDYTAQQSSGIAAWQRDTDHIEKAFVFGGMSARNGVTASHLVQLGWNGVDDVFSGADNFFRRTRRLAIRDAGRAACERYEITRTDIKVDGRIPIRVPRRDRDPAEAAPFEVRTWSASSSAGAGVADVVDNRDIPDICLQHMVAIMLIDKTASFKAAHDKPRMADAAVLRRRQDQLVRDEPLQRFMPVRVAIVRWSWPGTAQRTR
jgi:hypothetical protein